MLWITDHSATKYFGPAPSRVSETVSNLERDLDVTLLYRSPRQLSLTHEGRLPHDQIKAMLAVAENGLDAINPSSTEPHGKLRVTAPAFVTQTALMDDFAAFGYRYPRIDLRFDFSDTPRDLINDWRRVASRYDRYPRVLPLSNRISGPRHLLAMRPVPRQLHLG